MDSIQNKFLSEGEEAILRTKRTVDGQKNLPNDNKNRRWWEALLNHLQRRQTILQDFKTCMDAEDETWINERDGIMGKRKES